MSKAIIRIQKLKSAVAVRRSMRHAFREQETPNADASRSQENTHLGPQSTVEAMQAFNAAMPDKLRKNGVLAVEYLVTGSPETMNGKDRAGQDAYFRDALTWLKDKHGAENVIYAGIHRDETTPHMYAYVIPKDDRGKLNCRSFFGAADALSRLQTEFADQVGIKHGLERGLEGSRARHTDIREYYARVNAAMPVTPEIEVPPAKLVEGREAYGKRVAQAVINQVGPDMNVLKAKATQVDLAEKKAAAAQRSHQLVATALKQQDHMMGIERAKTKAAIEKSNELRYLIANGGEPLVQAQTVLRQKIEQGRANTERKR